MKAFARRPLARWRAFLGSVAFFCVGASAAAGWPASRERVEGLLASELPEERGRGVALLWEWSDVVARPFVEAALLDERSDVRVGAARRAEFARYPLGFAEVRVLLESSLPEEVELALSLIRAPLAGAEVRVVERLLTSPSVEVRRRAVAALSLWGSGERDRVLPALRGAFGDADETVRAEIAAGLVWVGGEEASLLLERSLDDVAERVRVGAVRGRMALDSDFPRAETLLSDSSALVRAAAYEALLRRPKAPESERALRRLATETEERVWKSALRRLSRYWDEGVMRQVSRDLTGPRVLDLLEAWSRFGDERGAVVARLLEETAPEAWALWLARLSGRRDERIERVLLEAHRRGRIGADVLAPYFDRTKTSSPDVVVLALEALEEGSEEPDAWGRVLSRAGSVPRSLVVVVESLAAKRTLPSELRRELLRLLVGTPRASALGTPMLASTEPSLRALGQVLRLSVAEEADWEVEFDRANRDSSFRAELAAALPRFPWPIALRTVRAKDRTARKTFLEVLSAWPRLGASDVDALERFARALSRTERRAFAATLGRASCEARLPEILLEDAFVRRQLASTTECVGRLLALETDGEPMVRALALQRLAQLPLDAPARERATTWWKSEALRGAPSAAAAVALLAAAREWRLPGASLPVRFERESFASFVLLAGGAVDGALERQVLRGEGERWRDAVYPALAAQSAPGDRALALLGRCEDLAIDEGLAARCALHLDLGPLGGGGTPTHLLPPEVVIARSRGGTVLADQPLVVVDALGRPWLGWADERGRVLSPAGPAAFVDSAAAY